MSKPTREEVERWLRFCDDVIIYDHERGHSREASIFLKAYLTQEEELEHWQKMNRDMEECVDNVRDAMGLKTTHFLVLHDDVREMRLERDKLQAENQELERKCKLLCCRVGVLEMENHGKRKEE